MTRSRIQAHSNNGDTSTYVTKVLPKGLLPWIAAVSVAVFALAPRCGAGDEISTKPAESLYLQLGSVGLDPGRVYQVRGASLNRSAIQITLDDGNIAFTQDVMGQITGAFFEGDGEILLTPPDEVERRSMSLFTGMAILEERFATAYFRFNDDVLDELKPDLRAATGAEDFVQRWNSTAKNLANVDAMRLLTTFSSRLPIEGAVPSEAPAEHAPNTKDRFLHARFQGLKFGVFDVFYDSTVPEQIEAAQGKTLDDGENYYDVWTSFSPAQGAASQHVPERTSQLDSNAARGKRIRVRRYTITTEVLPPRQIHARAQLECEVQEDGARTFFFELSRYLQIESVTLNGRQVEFIHNPALEGTQLARRGNDRVAVVLPWPARSGEVLNLEFTYGGEVLAEAGSGLLYVGARGTWYPNQGLEMANFDLQFSYPQGWTLVATGKASEVSAERAAKGEGNQSSRWISERPIPLAGFNLGKYREATVLAGKVEVETYASRGVERNFPGPQIQVIHPPDEPARHPPEVIIPRSPSPVQTEVSVGESAARAIQYFAARFGPFPYSHLALTQMPGRESQGWPGLVFLSSYAFLNQQDREQLHFEPYRTLLQQSIPAHETAHQWWGDLVTWSSYRDQWFSEGLANYCALLMLQEKNPAGFREVMDQYRRELVAQDSDGMSPMQAGPVTLGTRLLSSRFPEGYDAISYGRGAWLFHMLRTMLNDAATHSRGHQEQGTGADEPFMRGLRKVRERYEGQAITTRELLDVFAEDLPPALRYEGKNSLDWFLNGWINGTSLPRLELKGLKITPRESGAMVTGTILQKDAPEDLVTSVPIYAALPGKQLVLLGRVFADGEETSFRLPAPAGSHKIVLDPHETVLTAPK